MENSSTEIMTAKQLAEYLQMSQITVCRLAREKKLPGIKIGKEWRFPKVLIDKLIASGSNFEEAFESLEANGSGQS
ncbi:MAG TPA: helix-turn-helix domain-containing protein [Anaerolineae bacterium]|jgi:excisionase family DNA binding protein|nr:helix-turn-helix domain-containing protein [Anaerolineae bacterium]